MKPETRPILVPLDGSALAEAALPWAARIARACGAPLLLARVVALRSFAAVSLPDAGITERALCDETERCGAYLKAQAAALRLSDPSLTVHTSLTLGRAATELLGVEQRRKPRLVVLATHGRTGLARWARGSVADAFVRQGRAPVLLVRRREVPTWATCTGGAPAGLRILVALDGSPLAEEILPLATSLAGAAGGGIVLASVVATHPEQAIGPYFHPALEAQRRDAEWYLAQRSAEALAKGVPARALVEVAHDVAAAIADLAVREKTDMIALSTRGRGPLGRLLRGSVADRVSHEARIPVLLYRPTAVGRQPAAEAAAEARVRAHVASRARIRAAA